MMADNLICQCESSEDVFNNVCGICLLKLDVGRSIPPEVIKTIPFPEAGTYRLVPTMPFQGTDAIIKELEEEIRNLKAELYNLRNIELKLEACEKEKKYAQSVANQYGKIISGQEEEIMKLRQGNKNVEKENGRSI